MVASSVTSSGLSSTSVSSVATAINALTRGQGGTAIIGGQGYSIAPSTQTSKITGETLNNGFGSSGGYSYQTQEGKGYEVSPSGVVTPVTPISPLTSVSAPTQAQLLSDNRFNVSPMNVNINQIPLRQSRTDLGLTSPTNVSPTAKFVFGDLLTKNINDLRGLKTQTENVYTDISKIASDLKDKESALKSSEDKINKITTGNVRNNEWVGSERDYNTYQSAYKDYQSSLNDYNKTYGKYNIAVQRFESLGGTIDKSGYLQPPTITAGLFGLQKQIPINQIDTSGGLITSLTSAVTTTTGATLGKAFEKQSQQFNALGVSPYVTALTSPQYAEKVGTIIGETAPYFIPVAGQVMFFGSAGEKLGRSIQQQGLGKGLVGYVTANPTEAGAIVLGGAGKILGEVSKTEQSRIAESLAREQKALEGNKNIFLQKIKGNEFGIAGIRQGENLKQVFIGTGKTEEGIGSTGKSLYYVVGKVPYKNILGMQKSVGFVQIGGSEAGTKVLPKTINQFGDITYGIAKGGEYPLFTTSTFFKRGENINKIARRLKEGITNPQERFVSYFESLSQRTKKEGVTKIRSPEELGISIKIPEETLGVNVLKPNKNIQKTPLSKTFGEQVTALKTENVLIPISKQKLLVPTITTKQIPVTEIRMSVSPVLTQQTQTRQEQKFIQKQEQQQKELQKVRNEISNIQGSSLIQSPALSQKVEQLQKQEQKLVQEQQLQLKQELQQRQAQVQAPKLELFKPVEKVKVPTPLPPLLKFPKSSTRKEVKDLLSAFKIFQKRKGKFEYVGTAPTPYLAGKKLKESLLSGLQASGFVTTSEGKKVLASELGLDKKFRVGKRNPYLLVQSERGSGGRLTTGIERKQIQSARRRKFKWF